MQTLVLKSTMKKQLFFSLFICIFLLCTSCGNKTGESNSDSAEGTILFGIKTVDPDHYLSNVIPSEISVKFKNDKVCVLLSAGMGFINLSFISDPATKTFTQLVDITGSPKKACIQNAEEIKKENDLYNIEVTPSEKTKMIAGYNCKMAHVHYKDAESEDFDIYYTNEIKIKNSNFATPYNTLDGVLMEYRIKKAGVDMEFTAKKVSFEPVEDTLFKIPEGTKMISSEELEVVYQDFQ